MIKHRFLNKSSKSSIKNASVPKIYAHKEIVSYISK